MIDSGLSIWLVLASWGLSGVSTCSGATAWLDPTSPFIVDDTLPLLSGNNSWFRTPQLGHLQSLDLSDCISSYPYPE